MLQHSNQQNQYSSQQVQSSNNMHRQQNQQPKNIMHPSSYNQYDKAQQYHLVQLRVPGKETQLLIPYNLLSHTTNQVQNPAVNKVNKNKTGHVSHEYVTQNQEKRQIIYPSYYNTIKLPLIKPLACPPLTPIRPEFLASQSADLVPIQEKTLPTSTPSTSQLIPLQEIPMPNLTQFHQQLSNVIDVLPEILSEEINKTPIIIKNAIPEPSGFLKNFLSYVEAPRHNSKRKRNKKRREIILDSDENDEYELLKKRQRKNNSQLAEEQKVEENNINYMDMIRPCSVQLKKLMLTNYDMPVRIVNDKIVKIRMPRTKNVSTNYKKITNIGFIEYPQGIAYKCLQETCRFQSYDQEVFEKHLINHHSQDVITELIGYCFSCNDFITSKSLIDEFDHLLEYHLQTKKKDKCRKNNQKMDKNSEHLDADEILAIKEINNQGKNSEHLDADQSLAIREVDDLEMDENSGQLDANELLTLMDIEDLKMDEKSALLNANELLTLIDIEDLKMDEKSAQLHADEILAIKEVLDAFEEIVADIDIDQDVMSETEENQEIVNLDESDIEKIENTLNCKKEDKTKVKAEDKEKIVTEKEPSTIAGRMINNRRKTVDIRENPPVTRRSSRYNSLKEKAMEQLPSVIVNSSNDGRIKMTIKNSTRNNSFSTSKHKKKKDKKVTNNIVIPLTPPESSYTDSDYSEHSTIDRSI